MLRSSVLCLLPLVICVTGQKGTDGIEYYGTSNVRYQRTYPPPVPLRQRPQSIPISTTTVSPPSTRPAAEVSKTNQLNATTPSGPLYIPRRRPFLLPRPTRPGSRSKQQATEPPIVVALQPTLFLDTQLPEITAPEPSITSTSQPSIATPPQVVIQLISGPQTPLNTSFQASAVEMSIPPAVVSPTFTPVPSLELTTVANSLPNASPVAIQPEKESVSFVPKPGPISQIQAKPTHQTKLELNPLPTREEVPQPDAESDLQSTPSFPTSGQVSYPIKLRPQITFVPVLDHGSIKEIDTTVPQSLNVSNINQGPTIEIPLTAAPVVATSPSIATNSSSVNAATQPPIFTAPQISTVTEIQPLATASILQFFETGTADTPPSSPFYSTLDTPTKSEVPVQPKTEPASYVSEAESIFELDPISQLEPELTSQSEPEITARPKAERAFQSKPNLPTPDQFSYPIKLKPQLTFVEVPVTDSKPEALKAGDIPESYSAFEPPAITTNQSLTFITSQTPTAIASQNLMTTNTPQAVTAAATQGSAMANSQPQLVSAPHIIIQLITPSQLSLSAASQLPVSSGLKPLAVAASSSPIPEVPQRPDQPQQILVSKVPDSESALFTSPESKGAAQPDSELAPHLDSETAFESEAEISFKPYSYPVKLRPHVSFVTVPDSASKLVPAKPTPPVLPPLLPRPNPIREPAYGRYSQPTTQYPITTSTHHMTKVPRVITPTQASHLSKSNTIQQPNYGRYTQPSTQYPIIATTQSTIKALPINISTSERPGSLKLDFVCKGNGYYAVDNECDTYILCQKNNPTKFSCPDGLYFNAATKYYEYPCVYPSEVQCIGGTGKQYPRPTRQCPKQYGLFSMNDGDCSKYIMCNIGVATVMNCPAGLVFNPTTESCDWVANVPQCNPQVFKDYICPDQPVDEYGVASDIIYKYKYGDQCKLYIACQRGYPRLLSCERGLAFDEASQSCVSSMYVQNCASYAA